MDEDAAASAVRKMMADGAERAPAATAGPSAIRTERIGRVALIAFDRPEVRNAWNVACVRETIAAIRAANADEAVGAIVLTGEGSSYCAGADLKSAPEYDPATGRPLTPATFTMGSGEDNWISLLAASKPVVAAINGPAVGIGATHPLAADIRVMAASAHFSFPFLRLGAMPECGSTALLPRLIGLGRATDVLLRSAAISADEALQWGLVAQVFPDAELRGGAHALAAQRAPPPPQQVTLTREMLAANALESDAEQIMRTESQAFVQMLKALKQNKPL
jgi:2-(1,2-epoxy-1,2-dihydrophenyl)acetyl-CoA isomerase